MACATLKRSLDWESLNQRPNKRRRCSPYGNAASPSSQATCSKTSTLNEPIPSAFADCANVKLTPELMAENIREQITRINRRKQLIFPNGLERMQDSESSGSEMGPDSPRRPDSPIINRNAEKGLFTFQQVNLICERLLKEREELIRQEYDTVLTNKLAEQYDAFVKFTQDQIQRRFHAPPSYLS